MKLKINFKKIALYLMIIISIVICVPSIIYLIDNKTVDGFDAYFTYTLVKSDTTLHGVLNGVAFISSMLLFSVLYFIVVKNEKEIFKTKKALFMAVITISLLFMITLPYLSSDIYYYLGDSWLASNYKQNPYYTSVGELLDTQEYHDEILNNTGCWKDTTSVYGPLWNMISTALITFSFGNLTAGLYIFKTASFVMHILNCFMIYKITKSRKYVLLYGLNPLVLIQCLSNVHNDMYFIFFLLVALYFIMKKKNMVIGDIFLALSIATKYSTALIVPFILIYYFRDKNNKQRIINCVIHGMSIVALVILMYLPYFRDFTIFSNMLVQEEKYSQSILTVLMLNLDENTFYIVRSLVMPYFIIAYFTSVFISLFNPRVTKNEIMKKYNGMMLIFIFIVLTTYQPWYTIWLLPTIMWQNKKTRRFILYSTITSLLPYFVFFIIGCDDYTYGIEFSFKTLAYTLIILYTEAKIRKILVNSKKKLTA